VLPMLEQAEPRPPDGALKLVQAYLRRYGEAEDDPNPDLIQRIRAVLISAGLVAEDDEERPPAGGPPFEDG